MAPPLEISIPSTNTTSPPNSKAYTLYAISLRQPLRSYSVQKRYSDFAKLNDSLASQAALPPPYPLPKKSWIKSTITSPDLTEARRQGLESYLRAINDSKDPRWRQTEAWRHFLNLPNNVSGPNEARPGAAASVGPQASDLEAARMDPSIWLDVHRDLKGQLSEARQALRKRDSATTAQAQHDASAEVKRWLVRAGTLISTLDEALATFSASAAANANDASRDSKKDKPSGVRTPQLGEGEIRRRRDLVSAAKKERDTLERQLNSYTLKNNAAGDSTASATPSAEQKDNLLKRPVNSAQPSVTSTSRRVLGAPIKETERTRELDNEGLLQLQQQIMQEQDSDVTDLTKVVQRMKEMGIQINDELELQNQMLGLLDKDVDRVGDKVNIAKKRIGKIN